LAFGYNVPSNINKSTLVPKNKQRASSIIRVADNNTGTSSAFGSRNSVFVRRKPSYIEVSPRGDKLKARYDYFDPEGTADSHRVRLKAKISKTREQTPKAFVSQP
jgi:hypothetical protein